MIWYDRTPRSVVVGCHRCGCREITTSQAAAEGWAVQHLATAHHGESRDHRKRIEDARYQRAIRASRRRDTPT